MCDNSDAFWSGYSDYIGHRYFSSESEYSIRYNSSFQPVRLVTVVRGQNNYIFLHSKCSKYKV